MADFPIRDGSMTPADLAAYTVPERTPTHVSYRGLDVYGMPPSSSGGITVGEALNILSRFPLGSEDRAKALFQYLEASRLAFADRNAYIGDSDYVDVPEHGLLDPAYAATRSCLIKNKALTSPVAPGNPYQPYGGCGSTTAAGHPGQRGAGDEPPRHRRQVGQRRQLHQHHRAAGRQRHHRARPRLPAQQRDDRLRLRAADAGHLRPEPARTRASGRARRCRPTIVLKNGKVDFAVGSPGGATIITTVLQIMINHVDFGMSLPDAIAAPRASQRNASATFVEPAFAALPVAHKLTNKFGENLSVLTGPVLPLAATIGNATGLVALGNGRYQAAAEPVRAGGGSALVVNPR